MPAKAKSMVREELFTTARGLSPLFDEAVQREQPVVIVRRQRERGVLLSAAAVRRVLASFRFHVDVLPEVDGFTLCLRELNIASTAATLREARNELLAAVRSYVKDYFENIDFYRHLSDRAEQEPFVLRLGLSESDDELIQMLFGNEADDASIGPAPRS